MSKKEKPKATENKAKDIVVCSLWEDIGKLSIKREQIAAGIASARQEYQNLTQQMQELYNKIENRG